MKKIIIFLLFSISLFSQEKEKDAIYIEGLNNIYLKLNNYLNEHKNIALFQRKKKLNGMLAQLEQLEVSYKHEDIILYQMTDTLYAKLIANLSNTCLYPLGDLDAIIACETLLEKKTTIPYSLALTQGLSAFAKSRKSNYKGSLDSYAKAISNLKKSKHPDSRRKLILLYLDLTNFYLEFSSLYYAEETLNMLYYEIEAYKDNTLYLDYKNMYLVTKSNILSSKGRDVAALALIKKVDLPNSTIKYNHYFYYDSYIKILLKNKKLEAAKKFYKLLYSDVYFVDADYYKFKDNRDISLIFIYLLEFKLDKIAPLINQLHTRGSLDKMNTQRLLHIEFEYYSKLKRFEEATVSIRKFLKTATIIKKKNDKFAMDVANYRVNLEVNTIRLNKINKSKERLIYNSIIGIISFIVCLIGGFFFYRQRQFKKNLLFKKEQEIVTLKSSFLEDISHEIRTPITSIIGYLTLLKEHSLDPSKTIYYVNLTLKNSERMINSLNSFLSLLKIEKGETLVSKPTNKKLNLFMKEIISFFNADFKIKQIDFYYKSNITDALAVDYDFDSLKSIIINLIANALKYSNAGSTIYCNVAVTETALCIAIKDNGFGITKADQKKIFSRFYQAENNLILGGFGIGLSLVSELLKKLNGTIDLETELNVGSIFSIRLPLVITKQNIYLKETDLEYHLISNDYALVEKQVNGCDKMPKVLIVDDNIEMIGYLQEILSSFLHCTYAFNGQEALDLLEKGTFDLIISDYKMPIIDGIQLKKEINKCADLKVIPFIMMTAVYIDRLQDTRSVLGINDYIEKPFTKNEIISRIQYLIELNLYKKKIQTLTIDDTSFEASQTALIDKIKNIVLENLTNTSFCAKKLASLCGYEQKQLNKILKSKLGLSIVHIILEVRLLKAYDLIVKNLHPTLNEVIYAVGMNSRPYFNKKFKERFGAKPGSLMRKYNS